MKTLKPHALTFDSVLEQRATMFESLSSDDFDPIEVDLSDVEKCDSAGLALLIDLEKQCRQQNKQLLLTNLSTDIEGMIDFYGLGDLIAGQP